MPHVELTVEEIMAILPETPGRIAALVEGRTEAQLRAKPAPEAWSVNEVLAHLRAAHDVLGTSMTRIAAEDRPEWRRLSPRAWMRKTDYVDWEFAPGFDAFRQQRSELLAVLHTLPPDAWSRVAVVTERKGRTERSLRFYGDWLAAHEVEHLGQIGDILTTIGER
jgi:hypothetical protein